MSKKGGDFESLALDFLQRIFTDLEYEVVRERPQKSGTQDGFDNLVEVVTSKYRSHTLFVECKDYSTTLNYTLAIEKIPHIVSTHNKIDLLLFMSPFEDFKNPNEPSKLEAFYDVLSNVCPVAFLTPEYYIKEYFRLYPDLFKSIYGSETGDLSEFDRKRLLNKFDKFIFSDKNLKKKVFDDFDRETYLKSIVKNQFYITRSFRNADDKAKGFSINNDSSLDMMKLLTQCKDHIAVLGNPGSGKTTELKKLALDLWESRSINDIIPFFKSLKDFNSSSTIPDVLPQKYENIPYLLVIFDGLDEVYDIIDFSNKLRSFFDEYTTTNKRNIIRFIISCRTTIYNKIVKNLNGFDPVTLNPVSEGQAMLFLNNKYDVDFLNTDLGFSFWNYRDILDNPFYLDLVGANYKKTGKLEISRSRLIAHYIESRLEKDENDKFRNHNFNKSQHLELSKKLAFAMEMMQLSSINDSSARAFVEDTTLLGKNPFLEQSTDKNWSFELKNIQEYLVASVLSKMEFEQLLSVIKVDNDINQVHPSWHNVITLLLNIEFEEKNTYNKLVQWLTTFDIEMIFQAKAELVSEQLRSDTFKKYFQVQCIEKTLWIKNEGTVGKFGDTPSNIVFLFEKALDKNLSQRTRISAIILLREMSLLDSQDYYLQLETLLIANIAEFEVNKIDFQQNIEYTISLVMEVYKDSYNSLIEKIIDFVSEHDHPDFVESVLHSISGKNFNYFKHFIFEVLDQTSEEKKRGNSIDHFRLVSTSEVVLNIFRQISDSETLLVILDFVIQRSTRNEFREKHFREFVKHCSPKLQGLSNSQKDRLIGLIIDVVTSNKVYHIEEPILANLAEDCSVDEEIFKKLLEIANEREASIYFLQLLIKDEWFAHIGNIYSQNKLPDTLLNSLRNGLVYDIPDRAVRFQKYIETETQFKFGDKIEESVRYKKKVLQQDEEQREFEVMFDVDLLKFQIERIFNYYKTNKLSSSNLDRFYENYYQDFRLQENVSVYTKQFFMQIVRRQYGSEKEMHIDEIEDVLVKSQLDRMEDIFEHLPKTDEHLPILKDFRKKIICDWLVSNQEIVSNFLINPTVELSSEKVRTIVLFLNFLRYFKFKVFEEDFLLNLLKLVEYFDFDFHFIDEMIEKAKVENRALAELKQFHDFTRKLPLLSYLKLNDVSFSLEEYSVREDLDRCLAEKNYEHAKSLIDLFYAHTPEVLKEVCKVSVDIQANSRLLSTTLNSLVSIKEYDFIAHFIGSNYDLLIRKEVLSELSAIDYLIKVNDELAFKKLKCIIMNSESNKQQSYVYCTFDMFTNVAAIDDLIDIARFSLSLSNYYEIFHSRFEPLRIVSETLISICKNAEEEVCKKVLMEIEALNFFNDKKQSNKFYHETLKDDLRNVIIRKKSRPYPFQRAIEFNRENYYLFY